MVLLIQRSGRLNRVVGQLGKLGNRFADSLSGCFLHRHGSLGDICEAFASDPPVTGQQSQYLSRLPGGADSGAHLPSQRTKLISAYAGSIASKDQTFAIRILLFAALVVGDRQTTHGGSGQRDWCQNGKQPSSRGTSACAQLGNCTYAATPVTRGKSIAQLHDVFLSLASAEAKFVEAGRGLFELCVVVVDFAQCRVVLVLADSASVEMLAQLLNLTIQFDHGRPGRVNGPQQAVQRLLLVHGGLGQGDLLLVELRGDLGEFSFTIGAGLGQLRQAVTLLGQFLRGGRAFRKRLFQRLHLFHQADGGLFSAITSLGQLVEIGRSVGGISRIDLDAEFCNVHRLTLNKCPSSQAVVAGIRHNRDSFRFHYTDVLKHTGTVFRRDADELHHIGQNTVIEAGRAACACAPLSSH